MELARGYLNPNSSNWKSVPLFTKDMDNHDDENEDPIDEEKKKEEDKRTEKKRKHSVHYSYTSSYFSLLPVVECSPRLLCKLLSTAFRYISSQISLIHPWI